MRFACIAIALVWACAVLTFMLDVPPESEDDRILLHIEMICSDEGCVLQAPKVKTWMEECGMVSDALHDPHCTAREL